MASRRATPKEPDETPGRPATTPELREHQLVSLAVDLAEHQIRAGTASSQVISHFLKLGSTREALEQTRLQHEIAMLKAKKEQLESETRMEELMGDAIAAFRGYSGQKPQPLEHDEFEPDDY